MAEIIIDPFSVVTTPLHMFFKRQNLSQGTGFFYTRNDVPYLVTNWHNFTGINPSTGKSLSKTGGRPDRITFLQREQSNIASIIPTVMEIYSDSNHDQPQNALWYVHPTFAEQVDVVVIPIVAAEASKLFFINDTNQTPDMAINVSEQVFILGYPMGILGEMMLPIWKKASIATEPQIDLQSLPKMLVDTATRSGMSGSPVVALSRRGYTHTDGSVGFGGDGRKLLGIYSGRLGDGEFEAQLGVVWKSQVIDEIIDGKCIGKSAFSDTT